VETQITFLTYLAKSLVVAVLSVIGTLLSSSLVAYGLTRIHWKGRETLFTVILATMMIPFPVLMVPLYSVFRTLGWLGTLMPLWVPAWFAGAFNIFLLRQFFLTIPENLTDAARIDGCSEFAIYLRIMLPLAKPALAVVALFQFLFAWNDFLAPMIFLTEPGTFTMALGLQQYQSQHGGSEWHLLMAAALLLVLPIVILFFFTQKTFIQGISTTGMKG
jgi:multiple sugar transport system permease protein